MSYNYNIPQPTDELSQSQNDILQNFTSLGSIAGSSSANTFSLNNTAGFNFLFSRNIGTAPTQVVGATFLWTQTFAPTGRNELFILNDATAVTAAGIPITAAGYTQNGWSYLASGILLKWGSITVNASPSTTAVNLNAIGPAYNSAFNVQVTTQNPTTTSYATYVSLTASTLTLGNPGGSMKSCNWFTIGY